MRKVVAGVFMSLDGVMQAPGGPEEDPAGGFSLGGWSFHHWDETMMEFMGTLFAQPFDLLLGRKTYEIFAAHWPYLQGDPTSDRFNSVTKYVATSSTAALRWNNSVALHDIPSDIVRLKQGEGPMLLTQGSSVLLQALLAHDLIDEFSLMTFPVILGRGKKLFGQGAIPAGLELIDATVSGSGVVMARYARSGPITTGSFGLEEPTDEELERRRKVAREG